jgi:hypothetical protein
MHPHYSHNMEMVLQRPQCAAETLLTCVPYSLLLSVQIIPHPLTTTPICMPCHDHP